MDNIKKQYTEYKTTGRTNKIPIVIQLIDYYKWSKIDTYKFSFSTFFPISLLEVEANLNASCKVVLARVYLALSYSHLLFLEQSQHVLEELVATLVELSTSTFSLI